MSRSRAPSKASARETTGHVGSEVDREVARTGQGGREVDRTRQVGRAGDWTLETSVKVTETEFSPPRLPYEDGRPVSLLIFSPA